MKPLPGAPLSSLIALVKNRTRDANEFLAASIAIGPIILIGSLPPGAQSTLGAHAAAEGSISGAGGIFSHFGVIGYRWNSARGSVRRGVFAAIEAVLPAWTRHLSNFRQLLHVRRLHDRHRHLYPEACDRRVDVG